MKIGIDISQLAFPGTGVANYLQNLIESLIKIDRKNTYILFFSSLRGKLSDSFIKQVAQYDNVHLKQFRLPPTVMDLLWNRLHIMPIENFIGHVDVFITSDWTEPPAKSSKKLTILYDFIIYKYPEETHQETEFNILKKTILPNIVATQKRKHYWTKKESSGFLCISEATKRDAINLLGVNEEELTVIYPGLTL